MFFFRIFVFFYFWGIRNCELILDRFLGTSVIKICTEKWNKLILFERRNIWGVANGYASKKTIRNYFCVRKLSFVFLEFKEFSWTHLFFYTFFDSFFSWQKNFRKKEQPKFLYETLYWFILFFKIYLMALKYNYNWCEHSVFCKKNIPIHNSKILANLICG